MDNRIPVAHYGGDRCGGDTLICPDCNGIGAVEGEREWKRCRTCGLRGVLRAGDANWNPYGLPRGQP